MDTIHPPKTRRPFGAYHQDELRPFSAQLAAYTRYALMIIDLRSRARSVRAMGRALENNIPLRLARAAAQLELQSVYDHIAFGLRLPRIPVRLPLRKRVRAAGLASFLGEAPREIRIFPIHGHAQKIRRRLKPEDLGISSPSLVCEILLHEHRSARALGVDAWRSPRGRDEPERASQTAHIHAAHFTKTWDHGLWFIKSYMAIERVMLGFGFCPLLTDALRFAGCPPGSPAAKLQGTKRPPRTVPSRVSEVI